MKENKHQHTGVNLSFLLATTITLTLQGSWIAEPEMWQIRLKNPPIWIIFSHSEYERNIWGVRGTSYSLSLVVTKTRVHLKASKERRGCCSVGSFIRTEQHFLNKRRFTKGAKAFSLLLNWLWTEFSLTGALQLPTGRCTSWVAPATGGKHCTVTK